MNNETNLSDEKYKSSTLLLQYISKEYDKEDERSKKIESRIPIFITITTFLCGYMFSKDFNNGISNVVKNYKLYTVYIVLYVLCVMFIALSVGLFAWTMFIKKYKRIKYQRFDDIKLNSSDENKAAYELIRGYKEALDYNIIINDKKTKGYIFGIASLMIFVILFIIIKVFIFLND